MKILFFFFILILIDSSLSRTSPTQNNHQLKALLGAPSVNRRSIDKEWLYEAINKLWTEREHMKYTPLIKVDLPSTWKGSIMMKNESASRTESLKHRYAWCLFMWALVEGKIDKGTEIIEISSGNTGASEAYFAKLLGLKQTVIVPDTLEAKKLKRITKYGASVVKVPISERFEKAEEMSKKKGTFFMNQFANSGKAEEFHYVIKQLNRINASIPDYFVHAAGTGGTISSVGRFVRKYALDTEIVLADTQYSVYADYVLTGRFEKESGKKYWVPPGMAGFGYGSMGAVEYGKRSSLQRNLIDIVVKVPDLASTAGMAVFREFGIDGGTSTSINLLVSLSMIASSSDKKKSVVTLLADNGKYYESSYYNETWIEEKFKPHGGLKIYNCWKRAIKQSLIKGTDPIKTGDKTCAK